MKKRLDQVVVELGWAESREKAKRLILAGKVCSGTEVLTKPGFMVEIEKIDLSLAEQERYVSRGGKKLEGVLLHAGFSVNGFKCLDIGSSTGGFTDCLLQNEAAKVVCVDVGSGVLHWRLRNDPRVEVYEKVNARFLTEETVGTGFDLVVSDVSFISLKLIIGPAVPLIRKNGFLLCLVKPQFEAGREQVKKGVVRSEEVQMNCVRDIVRFGEEAGLVFKFWEPCCIKGPAGNQEYFVCFEVNGEKKKDDSLIEENCSAADCNVRE